MKTKITTIEKMEAVIKRLPGSGYKMGDLITLTVGDNVVTHDTREYYSGRGAKYNSSIKHGKIDVVMTEKELNKAYKPIAARIREQKQSVRLHIKNKKEKAARVLLAANEGVYNLVTSEYGTFVELSDKESEGKYFDTERLAKTLKISVADAELLNSHGKTYVFAKSEDGNTYELYHSSLSCNPLNISVSIAKPERIAEFIPDEWQSAPYAGFLGQTTKANHFVC